MQDKREPQFNPDSIRESVKTPLSELDDRLGALEASQTSPKGSGVLLNFVLLIMVFTLVGMGWFMLEQSQQLETAQGQIEQLELLLDNRIEDEQATETTLVDQVEGLQTAQLDAHQQILKDIEQLQQALGLASKERQTLEQSVTQLQQNLSSQNSRLESLQNRPEPTNVSTDIEQLSASLRQLETEVTRLKSNVSDGGQVQAQHDLQSAFNRLSERQEQQGESISRLADSFTEQGNQLESVERQIQNRIERLQADVARAVESSAADSRESEIVSIELELSELREDIRAINNARQLINRDLLQLREQINRIQLRLND